MAKLYPPYLEGTLPAFCLDDQGNGTLTIPFAHNRAVSTADIGGIAIKVKTVQNDVFIADFNSITSEASGDFINSGEISFAIKDYKWPDTSKSEIKIGQFYKIQIAYKNKLGDNGYFSTVGVIKCTSQPLVIISNFYDSTISLDAAISKFNKNNVYNNNNEFVGYFRQAAGGDITEKVYSSNFTITDLSGKNVIETTGDVLHNIENNANSYESKDIMVFNRDLEFGKIYKITYTVTTTNGCVISSPTYLITQQKSLAMELKGKLLAKVDYDEGFVDVSLESYHDERGVEEIGNGTFILSREDASNPGVWDELHRFALKYESPAKTIFRDFTIEQGKTYTYSLQQYNEYDVFSSRKKSNQVYADFEDMFLFDGERQLKLKFNPQITSFKTQLSETRTETIGSKYPFFYRNAMVGYKTFPISGLISMLVDDNEYFTSHASIAREDYSDDHHDKDISRKLIPDPTWDQNLVSRNIASERIFKLKVLDWVNNGKVKLFKSPTEGNYLVRLMENSLAPQATLGRMLHTYTGTAYESADYTHKNMIEYGIITNGSTDRSAINSHVTSWNEKNVGGYTFKYSNYQGRASENLLTADIAGVSTNELRFEEFLPGTKIRLVFEATGSFDATNSEDITIGATGNYYATDIEPVYGIYLLNDSKDYADYQQYKTYENVKKDRLKKYLTTAELNSYNAITNAISDQLLNLFDNNVTSSEYKKWKADIKKALIAAGVEDANDSVDEYLALTGSGENSSSEELLGNLIYYLVNRKGLSNQVVLDIFRKNLIAFYEEKAIADAKAEHINPVTDANEWKDLWSEEYKEYQKRIFIEELRAQYPNASAEKFESLWTGQRFNLWNDLLNLNETYRNSFKKTWELLCANDSNTYSSFSWNDFFVSTTSFVNRFRGEEEVLNDIVEDVKSWYQCNDLISFNNSLENSTKWNNCVENPLEYLIDKNRQIINYTVNINNTDPAIGLQDAHFKSIEEKYPSWVEFQRRMWTKKAGQDKSYAEQCSEAYEKVVDFFNKMSNWIDDYQEIAKKVEDINNSGLIWNTEWEKWEDDELKSSASYGNLLSADGKILYKYDIPVRNNFESIANVTSSIESYRQVVGEAKDLIHYIISPDHGKTENVREEITKIAISNFHKRPVEFLYYKTNSDELFSTELTSVFMARDRRTGYRPMIPEFSEFYWDSNYTENEVFDDKESMLYSPFALYVIRNPFINQQKYLNHIHSNFSQIETRYESDHNGNHLFEKYYIDSFLKLQTAEELVDRYTSLYLALEFKEKEYYDEYLEHYEENLPSSEVQAYYRAYQNKCRELDAIWNEVDPVYVLDAWTGAIYPIGEYFIYNPTITYQKETIDLREIQNYSIDNIDVANDISIDIGNGVYGEIFFQQVTKIFALENTYAGVMEDKNIWMNHLDILQKGRIYSYYRKNIFPTSNGQILPTNSLTNNEEQNPLTGSLENHNGWYAYWTEVVNNDYARYLTSLKAANDQWIERE